MLHLLDANVLIDAHRDYYPIDRVPEFWAWLAENAIAGTIAMPLEIYEEVAESDDELGSWLKTESIKRPLLLPEQADPRLVDRVVREGYAPDLSDDELDKLGRDPFLIPYALVDPANRVVVTTEGSRPARLRANRHVPDVCRALGITAIHTFQLTRVLNFSTSRGS